LQRRVAPKILIEILWFGSLFKYQAELMVGIIAEYFSNNQNTTYTLNKIES